LEAIRTKTVNRSATTQKPAAVRPKVQPKAATPRGMVQMQSALKVSTPQDAAEKEADATAKKIMRMSVPESSIGYVKTGSGGIYRQLRSEEPEQKAMAKPRSPYINRFAETGIFRQRREEGQPQVTSAVAREIQSSMAGGQPLPNPVRRFMEPRFQADFSNVKIHKGDRSAKLNRQLSAQAFTVDNHIFFGQDKFKPEQAEGQALIAHELTHTIQQGGAIQRSEDVTVTQQSPVQVQRLGLSDALDYFADKANFIPGFRMFTIILGVNPINMRSVNRSAANILRAIVEFIPGGGFITQALDNHGVFDKVGNWVEQQIKSLGLIGSSFKQAIDKFLGSLSWSDIFDLGGVWNRAKRIFMEPIDQIISFGKGLITGIIKFVKDAILKPLTKLAEGTRGYDLLKAVLGEDPITGEPVPRSADNLIGGFMKLIGQEEVWENIKKGKAISRAWAWFQGALSGLMGFVKSIPSRIVQTFTSLTISDIVTVAGAFTKIVGSFASIASDFLSWGLKQVLSLLEILFSVVAPGAMPYVAKAKAAFATIVKDPVKFVGNLVRAGKLGFQMFADNILEHLKTALIRWITGPLGEAGVYIPQSFSLMEIVKLVLSVLGLTWQNIRGKLVKIIPEPVLVGLEKTASVLVTLVRDGPAAAWEQIKGELTELKDQMIAQVTQMITSEVVKAAVAKLVSMLNPAGAVVQAIIATYNTITFFIEKANQIAAVVASFVDSISAIASGQVTAAGKRVEMTLANTLTLVIGFLAKFVGLGNVPTKLLGIINKVRAPIDRGLDKIVGWLVNLLKKAGTTILQAGLPQDPNERLQMGLQAAVIGVKSLRSTAPTMALINPILTVIRVRYGFKMLRTVEKNGKWWVEGQINPSDAKDTGKNAKLDLSKLKGSHDKLRSIFNNIEKLWKQGKITKALDRDPTKKTQLTASKNTIAAILDDKNPSEKQYQLLLANKSSEEMPPENLKETYDQSITSAEKLQETLKDLSKSPEELEREVTELRKKISAHYNQAKGIMSAPNVILVLGLPTFSGLKTEITDQLKEVEDRIKVDQSQPKTLEALREDFKYSDQLRITVDRANNLGDINKAIKPFIDKIGEIIKNTTKAGRPDATTGDGSTESAAIKEAQTGQPTKNRWHGPKCRDEAEGLQNAITALTNLRGTTKDQTALMSIDNAIKMAKDRRTKLLNGWKAWENSPYRHLAK
jgi:hypothetical protein